LTVQSSSDDGTSQNACLSRVLNYTAVQRWDQGRTSDVYFFGWTLRIAAARTEPQPHGPAQWCDETHNSLLKSCMATFQPLGTLGSCLDFRKFPKLAAPRGAALHVMYCTCVNMCNGWLFVPVHVCVPAPPGVFLPDHESTGTCRPRGAVDSGPAALRSSR
jgi:hypothetical protein